MIEPQALAAYCDDLLDASSFNDYAPNGLQVEGDRPIRRIVSGVTASAALIEAAASEAADALLVHHGWFWRGESPRLVGMKGRRARALMQSGMSLLAYHLPLDAHPQLGNNAMLARRLQLLEAKPAGIADAMLWVGRLQSAAKPAEVAVLIRESLGREPLAVGELSKPIQRLAWCTGGGQGYLEQAAALGVDAFLSGEISEQTTHQARELGVVYFAAGHHATERYGVQALGDRLAAEFGIGHRFVDIDNPA